MQRDRALTDLRFVVVRKALPFGVGLPRFAFAKILGNVRVQDAGNARAAGTRSTIVRSPTVMTPRLR